MKFGRTKLALLLFTAVALAACAKQTLAPAPLTISTVTVAPAQVNAVYLQQLHATGGTPPYVWALANGSLPPGLTLSTAGVLSGVPTARGQFSFTVRVTDSQLLSEVIKINWSDDAV